jgi:Stage II sporulation protein E (SpoIIE)
MARSVALPFLTTAVFVCGTLAAAQPTPPSSLPAGAQSAAHVTLGQSAVPLYGPWKFTVGDSPIDPRNGQPLWAEPNFDDSRWETVDLTPKDGAIDPISGLSGFVPGWTANGHPGYWGYAWYRIRAQVEAQFGQHLALTGPSDVDDIYQVFSNGELVGHFGDFSGSKPVGYYSQPMMFPLPATPRQGEGGTSGSSIRVLAFRLYMLPATLTTSPDPGGFHTAPVLGDGATVAAFHQMRWVELVRAYSITAAEIPLFGVMAFAAFTFILFDRSDRVYLWIGSLFLLQAVSLSESVAGSWTQTISITTSQVSNDGLITALIFTGWVMLWWVWFGRQRPAWTPIAAAALALLYFITVVVGQEMLVGLVPHRVAAVFLSASVLVRLLFLALQLWIVFQGIRRQGLEGFLVLPAVLLWGVGTFSAELSILHIPIRWPIFGLSARIGQISNALLVAVVAVLLLRRLLHSMRTQRLMALDVKQAQEVQQVILPEARVTLPGLTVESEYRPAREVGGDFFQIIPHKPDGSLLIVAGDVSGKGLKAGMLVALLVGAIRTAAETSDEPEVMLATLNRRLMGRGDAQATCLALRIASDGAVTLANAGHLAPYLNGEPIAMEGALPLGMMESAEFSIMHFQLKPDDKLVLMSDGIAEATDADGHLFGFERVNQLLRDARSVVEIASTAQAFGQEDDISVISVTRTEELEAAAA